MLRFDGRLSWATGDTEEPRDTCRLRAYQTNAGMVFLFSDVPAERRLATVLDPVMRRFMVSGFEDAFWVSQGGSEESPFYARIRTKNDEFGLEPLPGSLLRELLGAEAPTA